jgi:hypothetical protein
MSPKLWKIAKRDLAGGGEDDPLFLPMLGVRYVVQISPTQGPKRGRDLYRFRSDPPRTNSSREERAHGWLGMTDNVNYYGCGRWQIVGESRTHLHLAPAEEDDPS